MKIFYLVKKEFIEIFRQKEMLPLLFIMPIIQILVLGYVAKTDVKNLPVSIVNLSKNQISGEIIDRLCNTDLFVIKKIYKNNIDVSETLKKGEVKTVIFFRDQLAKSSNRPDFPEIQIIVDGIDSNTSQIAAGYFNGIIRKYISEDIQIYDIQSGVVPKSLIRFNPSLESINFMGPGLVAVLLTIVSLFFTSVSIVREKEQQTMDTLLVSQLKAWEIYIGKALPLGIVGLLNMTIGTVFVMAWFKIPMKGSFIDLIITAAIFLSAILSYGLFISTISSTQQQALFFSWFSIITFILLSGLLTPTENIPSNLQFLVKINPLAYVIRIIREIFLKGNSIGIFYPDLIALTAITLVIMVVSISSYKKLITN